VKKNITFDDYKNCVLNDEPKNVKINAIRTFKMINYSLTQNKLALSNKDDKRVWKNTTSTAWGHWRNLGELSSVSSVGRGRPPNERRMSEVE
jgi:hypothetical protein